MVLRSCAKSRAPATANPQVSGCPRVAAGWQVRPRTVGCLPATVGKIAATTYWMHPAIPSRVWNYSMDWGMQNRLAGIISPTTRRCVMLAVDHGYFQGPTSGLEQPGKVVAPLLPFADALMLTRGVLRNCIAPDCRVPIVLRVSGGTSVLQDDLSNEDLTVSIEDAVRVNASALAISIFVGSEHEKQTLANLARLCDEGQRYGIPVLAVTAVGKQMTRDARYLGLACRIAAELGAHIVKTYHCEGFEKVVAGCPVPVVIAGGKKIEEREALLLAYRAVSEGAVGVDMGRNIFLSNWPVSMIQAVRSIVHEGSTDVQAWEAFVEMAGQRGALHMTQVVPS